MKFISRPKFNNINKIRLTGSFLLVSLFLLSGTVQAQCVNAGLAMAAICQGGTSAALGGSFTGDAINAIWDDGGAGGSFSNNGGSTPDIATYTASLTSPALVTLTLTATDGTCTPKSDFKTITVNPLPTVSPIGGGAASVCVNASTPAFTDATAGGTWSVVAGTGTASITTGGVVTGVTAGTVTVTYTVTNSCNSTAAIQPLTVNPLATVSPIGGGAASVCVNASTPAFTDATAGGTWSVVAGTGTASITAGGVVTGLTAGTVTVTYTVTNSCNSTAATQPLTVNPLATVSPIGGGAASVCVNASTPAFTDATAGGTWSVVAGTGTASITAGGVVTGLTAGTVTVTYTVTNSCSSIAATQPLTVNPLATVSPIGGGAASVCVNASTPAFTDATAGGTWSVVAGTGTASITTGGVVTGLTAGTVTVTYTVTNSCNSTAATQPLTVNPLATVSPIGGGAASVCVNASIPAFTDATAGGTWSVVAGTGTASITAGGVVTGLTAGTVTVTYTVTNSCSSIAATQPLTINPGPTANAGTALAAICQGGTSSSLGGSVGGSATGGTWSTTAGGTFSPSATDLNATWSPPAAYIGTATLILTTSGGTCGSTTASKTQVVNANAAITLTSGAGSNIQTLCLNSPITNITYSVTGGATDATATGLPAGLSNVYAGGVFIITGTPSVTGTYNYVVTTTGTCTQTTATGTITINPNASITLTSPSGSNNQTLCINTPITNITYSVSGGGTGAGVTGLPTGLGGIYNGGVYTISGSPGGSGTFNYTVTTTGTCTQATATGTIIVSPVPVPTLTSSDADNMICQGSSVTFTAGGGTNYNFRIGGVSVQNGPSTTYTTTTLSNGQTLDVIVSNSTGCSATSAGIVTLVNPLPFIFVASGPTCSPDRTTYSFSVVVSSGTVTSSSGTVANTGVNTWSISEVSVGTNTTVTVTDASGCINTTVVTAPDCSCPVISPPVSGGDKSYCASGVIPTITATVNAGETVDWYDASSGGTLLVSGALSYTPTSPGTFYALARNTTSGCASSTRTAITVTMNPLPLPTLTSSDADNIICTGTSVTFTAGGGTSYNFRVEGVSVQSGTTATYTTSSLTNGQVVDVIVTSDNGCTATSPGITTTVNSLPTATLVSSDADNTICKGSSVVFTAGGGTSYNFRLEGVSVQNGSLGTYTTDSLINTQMVDVIVTNANGCSATSTGIATRVLDPPDPTLTSSDADNTFCSGTSVTFTGGGGTSYNFRVDGISVQNSTTSNYTTSTLTNNQVVDVIVLIPNGCTATSAGITNTVTTSPTADAGAGGSECDLNFTFSAVPSVGTGTWTKTSGTGTATFSPSANSPTATVTVSEYGTYVFTWTEVNSTCSNSSPITVNFYQQPVADAGTGGNNCGPDFFLNAVPSSGIGTWTKKSGPGTVTFSPDANTANATVSVSTFGQYSFTWTEVDGTCSSNASINVNFIQAAVADAGDGGIECDLDFVLNATPSVSTGTWTKYSGPGNAVFSPDTNQADATVTVDKYGAYTFAWTEVNSTCQSLDTIQVIFDQLPEVSAGKDTSICKGNDIPLQASGTGSFHWSPESGFSDPNLRNVTATPDTTTYFKVVLTDQFGCKNSDSIKVSVLKTPIANAGPDQILDYQFTTTLQATEPAFGDTGTWSLISGDGNILDTFNAETQVNSLGLNENLFLWKVSNEACPASYDSVSITVRDLIIPSLITPNMDGKNDYFVIKGISSIGTELVIFNRRGVQVYKNENYDNSWNGVDYKGNPLPDDTYFYTLRIPNVKSISRYIVIKR